MDDVNQNGDDVVVVMGLSGDYTIFIIENIHRGLYNNQTNDNCSKNTNTKQPMVEDTAGSSNNFSPTNDDDDDDNPIV